MTLRSRCCWALRFIEQKTTVCPLMGRLTNKIFPRGRVNFFESWLCSVIMLVSLPVLFLTTRQAPMFYKQGKQGPGSEAFCPKVIDVVSICRFQIQIQILHVGILPHCISLVCMYLSNWVVVEPRAVSVNTPCWSLSPNPAQVFDQYTSVDWFAPSTLNENLQSQKGKAHITSRKYYYSRP